VHSQAIQTRNRGRPDVTHVFKEKRSAVRWNLLRYRVMTMAEESDYDWHYRQGEKEEEIAYDRNVCDECGEKGGYHKKSCSHADTTKY